MCGVRLMTMERIGMKAAGPPHDKGISWEKFCEHRGYAAPGYDPKHPKDGEDAPACVFFDETARAWSTAGCEVLEASGTSVRCSCEHLTYKRNCARTTWHQLQSLLGGTQCLLLFGNCQIRLHKAFE